MDNKYGQKPSDTPAPEQSETQNTPGNTAGNVPLAESPGIIAPLTDADTDMNVGDSADRQRDPPSDDSVPQLITGQLADTINDNIQQSEEIERLKIALREITEDRDFARSECQALRAMRKDTQELLDSVESRLEKLKATNKRLREERDDADREKEDWRLKALDLEDENAELKEELENAERNSPAPAPVSPLPRVAGRADPPLEADFVSMYGDEDSPMTESGSTPASTHTGGGKSAPAATPSAPKLAAAQPATSTYAQVVRRPEQPKGAPKPSTAPRNSLGAIGGAPPIDFRAASAVSRYGLDYSDWASDTPTGVKGTATEPAGESRADRGRPAPRRSFGGKSRGGLGGRGGGFQGSRMTAHQAVPPELEWTGRYYVHTADTESAQVWRNLDAQSVHERVSGNNRTRVDETLQATQRLLIRNARMVPREFRTATQVEVIDFAKWAESMGNHPLMQRDQVSPGARRGEANTINALDMTVQRFLRELRPREGPMRDHTQLISRVNHVLREIFSRPGEYERLLAVVAPNTVGGTYDAPLDVTFLTEANRLTSIHFTSLEGVNALSVTQYLWNILWVPCAVARHVLEPYFRRMQRHSMAQRALNRLVDQEGVTDEAIDWVRETGSQNARVEFVVRVTQRFVVRELGRQIWRDENTGHWQWMLPPPSLAGPVLPPMEALQGDNSFGEVEISLDWIPEYVRDLFEPDYQLEIAAWEDSQILGEGDGGEGDQEMSGEAGTGPA